LSWLDRRRPAEKALEPEQRLTMLRDLVERHPAALLVTAGSGEILAASAAYRRLANPEGGADLADPSAWAADPDRYRRRFQQVMETGEPVSSEQVVLADGRVMERDYAPMDMPGTGMVHVWEYRDVTASVREEQARREAAARLSFLVGVSDAVLYSCRPSADHDRTFVSENITDMLGYDPSCWLEPGFWRRALHPDDAARVIAEMPRLRTRGRLTIEYRLRHEGGDVVKVRDHMRLICETEGRPIEIVGWLTDITAERHSETDLTNIGRVAAEVVHDFNNLLLVIAGHAHLLKGTGPESMRWHIDEIVSAVERASGLTERMRNAGPGRVPTPPAPRPLVTTPAKRGAGETVLLVEDEDAVRKFTGRVLAAGGYRVLEARRGEEALEIAARHTISALVTDLSMPGMSGYELAQRLSAAQPTIKIILMSGYDPADLPERNDAALSFLSKPFTPDVLAMRLRQVLDN
jgi:CheY-like chemotaxis protein